VGHDSTTATGIGKQESGVKRLPALLGRTKMRGVKTDAKLL